MDEQSWSRVEIGATPKIPRRTEFGECTLARDLGTTSSWGGRSTDGLSTTGTARVGPGSYEGGGMR